MNAKKYLASILGYNYNIPVTYKGICMSNGIVISKCTKAHWVFNDRYKLGWVLGHRDIHANDVAYKPALLGLTNLFLTLERLVKPLLFF